MSGFFFVDKYRVKIQCTTLFDITRTNVSSRRHSYVQDGLEKPRSQHSNFETVLQIISMRAQPENITDPEKQMVTVNSASVWGTAYRGKEKIPQWRFTFTVESESVFDDGDTSIGNLFKDSEGIPMIIHLEESSRIQSTIDSSSQFRNIYFEVIQDER